ncbi:ABC transporter ATP-binding protein [Luteimonas sp. RIT-PG2_3]
MSRLLELDGISMHYPMRRQWGKPRPVVRAVDDVSLSITAGESVGLVGESGSGKSTLARIVLQLQAPTHGGLRFRGQSLGNAGASTLRDVRSQVQAVFQDPYASLNPRMRIGDAIAEPLQSLPRSPGRRDIAVRVAQALADVELPVDAAQRYPHQFSGGQRQRIAIARALILRPALVVLDEPISALDVSIRAQILNLLADLRERLGMAYLFIAHDLPAVAAISDRIAVMYCGELVETGPADDVARAPLHPYTQMLFASVLTPHDRHAWERALPEGEPASPVAPPSGCRFHPRCPHAIARCRSESPPARACGSRIVRCHLVC